MPINLLIVEDNLKLASYLTKRLEKQGFVVSTESRGDRAAYIIPELNPDCVILDVMLPGLNGDQICNTVRDSYRGKILMLTAVNDVEMEVTTLNMGADDYLTKPVKEPVLIARIHALLRRPPLVEKLTHIDFGHLNINLGSRSVFIDNKKVELSDYDYNLLVLLAKNSDDVLSRDNITYALKGYEYDGVDRNIDLSISRLRKILLDDSKKPYRIKTVFKKGYMLATDGWEG